MAKMSEFKKLASLAKQRLKEGNYNEKKGMKNNFYNSYFHMHILYMVQVLRMLLLNYGDIESCHL